MKNIQNIIGLYKNIQVKTVKNIIGQYKNHPSIINIKNQATGNAGTYDFPHATAQEVNKNY